MEDLSRISRELNNITHEVGQFIAEEGRKFTLDRIEIKSGPGDLVSYVDKQAEERLVEKLSRLLPEAGIIAEEGSGRDEPKGLNWVIDPIDGTTNFTHQFPFFCVSVGLTDGKKALLGSVYDICKDHMYYGWQGGGAWRNSERIQISEAQNLDQALLATGFPYFDMEKMPQYLKAVEEFMHTTHGLRRLGSAALDIVYVASGQYDGFFEYNLKPWDVAGGSIILTEAGGQVSDFQGGENYIFGNEFICAGHIYEPMLATLRKHWYGN